MKRMAVIGLIFVAVIALAGCPTYVYPDGGGGGGSYYSNIVVYNDTSYEVISGVFLAPAGTESWSDNLTSYDLNPGGSLDINDVPDGCYDLYAEAYSGAYWTEYDICVYNGDVYDVGLSD